MDGLHLRRRRGEGVQPAAATGCLPHEDAHHHHRGEARHHQQLLQHHRHLHPAEVSGEAGLAEQRQRDRQVRFRHQAGREGLPDLRQRALLPGEQAHRGRHRGPEDPAVAVQFLGLADQAHAHAEAAGDRRPRQGHYQRRLLQDPDSRPAAAADRAGPAARGQRRRHLRLQHHHRGEELPDPREPAAGLQRPERGRRGGRADPVLPGLLRGLVAGAAGGNAHPQAPEHRNRQAHCHPHPQAHEHARQRRHHQQLLLEGADHRDAGAPGEGWPAQEQRRGRQVRQRHRNCGQELPEVRQQQPRHGDPGRHRRVRPADPAVPALLRGEGHQG